MRTTPIIYSLHDPATGELRYVGYSTETAANRLGHHLGHALEGSGTLCARWIRELMASGFYPVIRVIKHGATYDDEIAEIAAQRLAGARLLNVTSGGKGAPGLKHSPETRAKLSAVAKGRTWTAERRAAMSAAQKGKKKPPRSAEYRANIAAAKIGKKASDAARLNMSRAHLGKPGPPPLTLEQRARRSAAVSRSWIARRRGGAGA